MRTFPRDAESPQGIRRPIRTLEGESEEVAQFVRGDRPAEMEALRLVGARRLKEFQRRLVGDAFGTGRHMQIVGQIDDRFDDDGRFHVGCDIEDKYLIHFELTER